MEALGRLLNIVPTADAVWVRGVEAGGVAFVCVGADTYTVQEATTVAGAGAQNLPVVTAYYTNASAVGAAAWVKVTQVAGAAITIAGGCAIIHVSTKASTDGFDYLRCSSTAAGLVYAVTHDLTPMRDPTRYPALAS